MNLATQLVENGVEVRLDKWDLREGQDAPSYMESMVTDPNVTKVIVVSDKRYAEKADGRKGGVGTESQIMSANIAKSLQRFFERIIPFMSRPENVTSWRSCDYDNFIFIVHELFLYAASILLKYERFETLNELIELRFYCPDLDRAGESMRPYTIIQNSMDSPQAKQQELRRISLRADLLKQRNQTSGLDFAELMAADFILFLRAPWLPEGYNRWYPETLIYSTFRFRKPLEVFARSESKAFFAKLVDGI
jgi:hypothetical protein